MKTSSAYKLRVMRAAMKRGEGVRLMVGASDLEYTALGIEQNLNHSLVLRLDRAGGFLVVDPDDIRVVRLFTAPKSGSDDEDG